MNLFIVSEIIIIYVNDHFRYITLTLT